MNHQEYHDTVHPGPLKEQLRVRFQRLDQEAKEFAEELGLPAEMRFDLLAVVNGQADVAEVESAGATYQVQQDDLDAVSAVQSILTPGNADDQPEISHFSYTYILARTHLVCRGIAESDLQDIAQEAWIAFAHRCERGDLYNPDAYLLRIILNKYHDYCRQKERQVPTAALSSDDGSGEPLSETGRDSLDDPTNALDEQLVLTEFYKDLAAAIVKLPSRQQQAMICTLTDKVDRLEPLILMLKAHDINESQMRWPENRDEKHMLQASFSAARSTLANFLHIDLAQYKPKSGKTPKRHG